MDLSITTEPVEGDTATLLTVTKDNETYESKIYDKLSRALVNEISAGENKNYYLTNITKYDAELKINYKYGEVLGEHLIYLTKKPKRQTQEEILKTLKIKKYSNRILARLTADNGLKTANLYAYIISDIEITYKLLNDVKSGRHEDFKLTAKNIDEYNYFYGFVDSTHWYLTIYYVVAGEICEKIIRFQSENNNCCVIL